MLLHLPVGLSSRQTAQRRLSGAHNDRPQSHRQWLPVTAPAGRAYAVERVRLTCRREPRCCQTKQVPKKAKKAEEAIHQSRPKSSRPPLSTTPYSPMSSALALLSALARSRPAPGATAWLGCAHPHAPETRLAWFGQRQGAKGLLRPLRALCVLGARRRRSFRFRVD